MGCTRNGCIALLHLDSGDLPTGQEGTAKIRPTRLASAPAGDNLQCSPYGEDNFYKMALKMVYTQTNDYLRLFLLTMNDN